MTTLTALRGLDRARQALAAINRALASAERSALLAACAEESDALAQIESAFRPAHTSELHGILAYARSHTRVIPALDGDEARERSRALSAQLDALAKFI